MPAGAGFKSIAEKAMRNVTGRVEQAYLVVQDDSGAMASKETGGGSSRAQGARKQLTKNKPFTGGKPKGGPDVGAGLKAANGQPKQLTIPVQFNPSELMMNSSNQTMTDLASVGQLTGGAVGGQPAGNAQPAAPAAGGVDKGKRVSNAAGDGSVIREEPYPTNSLTVSLYFDEMRPTDSFILDKLAAMANPVDLAKTGANAVADLATKRREHSVQTVVEGLLALLQIKGAKRVTFCWNQFSFRGVVTTVQANYTMFNTLGAPVRAQVLLRIQEEFDQVVYNQRCGAFNNYFTGAGGSLSKVTDSVGALFNLNL